MLKYSTAPIVVPDASTLDHLADIQPGQRLLIGHEFHPVYAPDISKELSERAHALIRQLEEERRLMRFLVRQKGPLFCYIGIGIHPNTLNRIEAALSKFLLPARPIPVLV